jgi:quercetin dioxygenase-like cupin family protein
MKIFHFQDIEKKDAEKSAVKLGVRWLITKEMGAENFAMRLFEMEPKGYSPFHSHPWEHEVFILEGEGIVVGEGEETKFRPGNVIFIPPNEKHQFKNTHKKTVKFLCLIPYAHEYLRAHGSLEKTQSCTNTTLDAT